MKKFYMVNKVKSDLTVEVLGLKTKLDLNWAIGMIEAIPVFDTKENAELYANGTKLEELVEIEKKIATV